MMTQRLEVSILAAPLAAIDRRALSQAWYSALRLAPRAERACVVRSRVRPIVGLNARACPPIVAEPSRRARVEIPRVHVTLAKPSLISSDEARENVPRRRSPLAARIERAFGGAAAHPKRATFAMGRGNARVHVILQTKGEQTTLLAICRPELRAVVARALAQARSALAARGIGAELHWSGGRGCS
jgi:hypothetical protein